jgi:hypothetical protein
VEVFVEQSLWARDSACSPQREMAGGAQSSARPVACTQEAGSDMCGSVSARSLRQLAVRSPGVWLLPWPRQRTVSGDEPSLSEKGWVGDKATHGRASDRRAMPLPVVTNDPTDETWRWFNGYDVSTLERVGV